MYRYPDEEPQDPDDERISENPDYGPGNPDWERDRDNEYRREQEAPEPDPEPIHWPGGLPHGEHPYDYGWEPPGDPGPSPHFDMRLDFPERFSQNGVI